MLDTSAKERIFKRIRLVIVDRQPIVLQGLKSVLGAQPDFDVVASCSDGTSCIQAIRNLTPDVALLADTLPDLTASEILAIAKAERLPTRLVFFTDSDTDHDLTSAIAAGACHAIAKYVAPDAMLRSLRLMTKRSFLEQSDLSPTAEETDSGKNENLLELLTPRERQIVRLVSEGMSNKEIAHQLNVSDGTVKVHLHNIFQKLEITNRTVLATLALLQRPSGFGMLSLALLAVAIADELKASEANDLLPHDDSTGSAAEHAEYELWKRAILRHVIVADSDEKPSLTQRGVLVGASQISTAASAIEALRTAEQSAGVKSWKDYSSVGSSTPGSATPSLRGMNDAQIGGESTAEHLFSRLTSNPTLVHGGYGTFATLTGALIYALSDPHLALLSHDPAKAPLDSFVDVTGYKAATKLAAISNADDNHVDDSVQGFRAHDSRLSSAFVAAENESAAGEGETLQKLAGLVHFGHDAGSGGYSGDKLMGGNVAENVVHRDPTDSDSTSSGSVFNFASGPSRINLAAFGALARLHMTAASKSIPPHTIAWIFDSASNETIVYVNATDHVLKIGDRDLLEIHLQGGVSIAESDFVGQPTAAAAALTLEQLEEALTSVTATETVLSTDSVHTVIGTRESAFGTAGVWDILADVDWRTEFAPARTTEERVDRADGSARTSPIVLAHAAAVTAVESLTFMSQRIDADTGPSIAGSAGGSNSQHVLEPWPAKETGAEQIEAGFIPGSDVGDENANQSPASDPSGRSAKTAETDRVEHGNSVHSTSTNAPEAAEFGESSPATAHRDDREGARHAPEQMSERAGARDVAELKSMPGNRAGNDNAHDSVASDDSSGPAKTAEPGGLDHSNPHASERESAKAAPETAKVKSMPGNRAGNDNAHDSPASDDSSGPAKTAEPGGLGHSNSHAPERGEAKAVTETAKVKSMPGNRAGNDNAHDSVASDDSSGPAKTAEPGGLDHRPGGLDHSNPHASERESAKAATETAKVKSMPGNRAGNDNAHDSVASDDSSGPAKTAEPGGLDHSNPHASERESAKAATETAEVKSMPGNRAGNDNAHDSPASDDSSGPAKTAEPGGLDHSNSHAPERGEAKAATETAKVKSMPGNRAGNDNAHDSLASDGSSGPAKTAEPGGLDHSNPHASDRRSATAATETAEVKSMPGNRADNDNLHDSVASDDSSGPAKTAEPGGLDHSNPHASERRSATAATETAEVKSMPGNRAGNDDAHDSLVSDDSSGLAKTAEPGGLDHSNSHASERGEAKAATETAEAMAIPGKDVGNDNEHHSWTPADTPGSAKMAEPGGVEHSNEWEHSASAHGPKDDENAAAAGSADRVGTQNVAEPEPAKAAATAELPETLFTSEKGVGDGDNHRASNASMSATAATADLQHSNSGYNLPSTSPNASAATEIAESSATRGDGAGNGNPQHATQPAAIALAAAQPANAAFETGGADQERVFRFDSDATPFTLIVRAEPSEVHIPLDPPVQPGQVATPDILVKILPNALDEHAANHGNNGPHHATVPAHHDLLI
ncbi:LuxR C-terminal-related transcriptional regulator [Bradyrhizobium sp. WBAH42]|uniref:LuxR C-terminal-related transcriptional regulator n=3 Tax=Bradyrhizobium TaxID=374 RepID=UPI00211E26FA|nr:LuxR C-terminal-related transcriptional regulator [Bradyrhizobium sp. WBAH42]